MTADLDGLRAELRGSIESLARHLLGEPNRALSSRRELRWGRKGSLSLPLSGRALGTWFDHEAGTGGDALALVQHARRCSFADALAWARAWLGTPEPERHRTQPVARPRSAQDDQDAEAARKQEDAQRLWTAAVPLAGTPAEHYLVDTRRIPCPPGGWPADWMRWNARVGAWLLAVRDTAGALVAVQRVMLTPNGQNARRPDGSKIKLSLGTVSAGVVRLPGKLPVVIAEGPETATALWSATGHAVWAALGSTSRLTPPAFALLACDDDKRHSPAAKARARALKRWAAAGYDVQPVYPWPVRRGDKRDFADLIAAEGPAAVKARIAAALNPGTDPARRVNLKEAGGRLDLAVQGFITAVRDYTDEAKAAGTAPPVHAVRVDLGAGKSHSARRRGVVEQVRWMRAQGDTRTVAVVVPMHRLGGETETDLAALAPDQVVRTWRGRTADAPYREGKMCQEPGRVDEARRLRLDVQEFACRACPLADGCEYLAQHRTSADIWIVPAAMLERQPPKALGDLALIVVDEPPASPVVDHAVLPLAALLQQDAIKGDRLAGDRLASLRRLVLDAAAVLPDGPLPRAALTDLGMMEASAVELLALEWRSLVIPDVPPGASPAERGKALAAAERNADLGRRTMLAKALAALLTPNGPALSGHVEVRTTPAGVPELYLHARREMHPRWAALPALLLDGTLQMNLLRQSWPTAELVADLKVEAPHQRVRQIADGGFTLSALDADAPGLDDKERRRRERNLARLRVRLHTEARRHTGRVLVVCNQRIEARLRALGMPANIILAHFNAVRGLNEWTDTRGEITRGEDLAAVIIVGWTLPSAAGLERDAGAITGAAVPATGYQRADARRELADGTSLLSDAWQHPDLLVEALRWAACEAELLQAIARGRGVRRTEANPVDVLVLGEVVLPFPVDLVPADNPTTDEVQLAEGSIAYAEPAHASRAYPGLWKTPDAARKAAERWRTNPYKDPLLGECPPPPGLVQVRYQRAGAGQRPAEAWVHLAAVPDPRAAIEAQQGPLAAFEVLEPPPDMPAEAVPAPQRRAAVSQDRPDDSDDDPEDGWWSVIAPGWPPIYAWRRGGVL